MSLYREFVERCRIQEVNGLPDKYTFDQELMRKIRVFLVNHVESGEESDFLLDRYSSRETIASIEQHYVTHLKEFLQGAT